MNVIIDATTDATSNSFPHWQLLMCFFWFAPAAMTDYESDNEFGAYERPSEFPSLQRRSTARSANRVAAPGEAACALIMTRMISFAKDFVSRHPKAEWAQQIIDLLSEDIWSADRGPLGWCKWSGAHCPARKTDSCYTENLVGPLMEKNARGDAMLRFARRSYGNPSREPTRCFMSYFQVPKEPGPPPEDRTIGAALDLNDNIESVGGMQLASLLQLFDALRELPNAHLYIGDLKAWFNQISIPEGIKPLFTLMLADGRLLEYNTLVMGGQPSAKLAHGITCLWIIASLESIGLTIMDPVFRAAHCALPLLTAANLVSRSGVLETPIRNLADKFSRFKTFRLTKKDRLAAVTLIEQALEARDMGTCFVPRVGAVESRHHRESRL